mgnify:CR=1 FL=1
MVWVLVLVVSISGYGVSVARVGTFTTVQSCIEAGQQIKKDTKSFVQQFEFSCIRANAGQ